MMTPGELDEFKAILKAKQTEVADELRYRDRIAIETSADAVEEMQYAAERELAIRNLDRGSNLLRQVRATLRRLDAGTFGICAHCEEEISRRRLEAVPWTAFCLRCQEAADRGEQEFLTAGEALLPEEENPVEIREAA